MMQEVTYLPPQFLDNTCTLEMVTWHEANLFSLFLTDFEASFIRLLDKVTNGSRIEINQTGKLSFLPFLKAPTYST